MAVYSLSVVGLRCHLLRGRVVVVVVFAAAAANWSISQNCAAPSYYNSSRGHHDVYFYNKV
jgi:hypothetical protein